MDEIKHIGETPVDDNIANVLKKGASGDDVKDVQSLLYQIGFGDELNWDKYKDDGMYGGSLTAAVKAFADKNGIESDGTSITKKMGEELLERLDQLDEVQQLQTDYDADKIEVIYKHDSLEYKNNIGDLQLLLNELGYGEQLNWERYKNDGFFGKSTVAALTAFAADQGMEFNGKNLSKELAKKILDILVPRYGKDWNKKTDIQTKYEAGESPLTHYKGYRFVGKKLMCDKGFVPALERINAYAAKHDVMIHVTSSFRPDANVKGAVVKPARRSNHMVGHAFDFNVRYGDGHGQWANNAVLKNYDTQPAPVKAFIDEIRNDPGLRWGGDFRRVDAIHIDDGFNADRDAFDALYMAIRKS